MEPKPNIVEYGDDGKPTAETLKRAMKAFRKRLKISRLDQESQLGKDPLSKGQGSSIVAVQAPEQYPDDVWDHLVSQGRLEVVGKRLYKLIVQS